MTRRDFVLIAHTISQLPAHMRPVVSAMFAQALAETNPNFDPGRFIAACEVV